MVLCSGGDTPVSVPPVSIRTGKIVDMEILLVT